MIHELDLLVCLKKTYKDNTLTLKSIFHHYKYSENVNADGM